MWWSPASLYIDQFFPPSLKNELSLEKGESSFVLFIRSVNLFIVLQHVRLSFLLLPDEVLPILSYVLMNESVQVNQFCDGQLLTYVPSLIYRLFVCSLSNRINVHHLLLLP